MSEKKDKVELELNQQDYSVILGSLNEATIKGKDSIYFSQLLMKVQALLEATKK